MCLIGVAEGATGSGSRLGAGGGGALALTGAHGSTGVSPVVSSIRATRPIATRISVSIARRPAGKDRTDTHTATAGLDQDQRRFTFAPAAAPFEAGRPAARPSLAKVIRPVGDIT